MLFPDDRIQNGHRDELEPKLDYKKNDAMQHNTQLLFGKKNFTVSRNKNFFFNTDRVMRLHRLRFLRILNAPNTRKRGLRTTPLHPNNRPWCDRRVVGCRRNTF